MKHGKRLLFQVYCLIAFLLLTGLAFAKDNLVPLAESELTSNSKFLPQSQEYTVDQIKPGGGNEQFKYRVLVDYQTGNVTLEALSTDFEAMNRLNSSLQMTGSLVVLKNKDIIKKLSFDKIENVYHPERQVIVVKKYLNDQLKKTDEHRYPLALYRLPDFGVMELFLQSMLKKGITGFNSDIVMDRKKYNVDFNLEKVKSVTDLSTKYQYPEKFSSFLKKYDHFNLYRGEATGAIKLVFPHQFYFAYESTAPYKLIATWGGNPKECVYRMYR